MPTPRKPRKPRKPSARKAQKRRQKQRGRAASKPSPWAPREALSPARWLQKAAEARRNATIGLARTFVQGAKIRTRQRGKYLP